MVTQQNVQAQLKKTGSEFRFWGRSEVGELSQVLADDEILHKCVNGHYLGGFAMLVATDRRLILIDRKPMYLTIEAIWYDKIGQVDYNHRLLNATICISTPNKDLRFTTWNHAHLRDILLYSQEKMIEAKAQLDTSERHAQPEATPQVTATEIPAAQESATFTELFSPQGFQSNVPPQPASTQTSQQQTSLTSTSSRFPVQLPDKLTLYTATRLPFSRRRYFVPTV